MPGDATTPTETVTRPDNEVGSPGRAPAGGGRQTPEQARLTERAPTGGDDSERKDLWSQHGEPGRSPPTPGGSSGGHSDQKASRGPEADRPVAGGLSKPERKAEAER